MPVEQLNRAIALIKSGQKDSARVILTQLVRVHPENDVAWLWLAESITDESKRFSVLEAGLKINPQSQMLQRGLDRLHQRHGTEIGPDSTTGSFEESEIGEPPDVRQTLIGKAKLPKIESFRDQRTPADLSAEQYGSVQPEEAVEIAEEFAEQNIPETAMPRKPTGRQRHFTLTQDVLLLALGIITIAVVGFAGFVMKDQISAWLGLTKAAPTQDLSLAATRSAMLTAQAALAQSAPTLTPSVTSTVTPQPTPTTTVAYSFPYPVISPENGPSIMQIGELSAIPASSVAFSLDNQMLAAGMNDSTVYVWILSSGEIRHIYDGHTQPVLAVAFSPDSKYLVSGSVDKTVRIWDLASDDEYINLTGHAGAVTSVAFSPDGQTIASGSMDGEVLIWQLGSNTPRMKLTTDSPVESLDISKDGRLLVAGLAAGILKVWDIASGDLSKTMPGHAGAITSAKFAPNGHRLVTGSADKTVKLWDLDSGRILYTIGTHTDPVVSVSFSPNGQMVASTSQGQTLKLWDVAQRREIVQLRHTREMPAIAFSSDGRVIASALSPINSASVDGGVALWGVVQESGVMPTLEPLAIDTLKAEKWAAGARMAVAHAEHQSVLLSGERVLIISGGAGKDPASYTPKVELYNPVSGSSLLTGGLDTGRAAFSATSLRDGRVLVVGGTSPTEPWIASAEIYDPIGGVWTTSQPLHNHGFGHTATELADGRVLLVGGCIGEGASNRTNQAELFNPGTNSWINTGALGHSRCGHIAAQLPDGKVLVAGGEDGNSDLKSAELYDPVTGQWQQTGDLNVARRAAVAVRLMDGRVMVTGGELDVNGTMNTLDSVEIYDPSLGAWQSAAPMLEMRYGHTLTLLPGGLVLVVGGIEDKGSQPRRFMASVDVYNPLDDTWTPIASTKSAHGYHTANLLADGRVFIAGGMSAEGQVLASTEILVVSRPPKQEIPTPIIWPSRTPTIIPEFSITSTLTGTLPSETTPTPEHSASETPTPQGLSGSNSPIAAAPSDGYHAEGGFPTALCFGETLIFVRPDRKKLILQRG